MAFISTVPPIFEILVPRGRVGRGASSFWLALRDRRLFGISKFASSDEPSSSFKKIGRRDSEILVIDFGPDCAEGVLEVLEYTAGDRLCEYLIFNTLCDTMREVSDSSSSHFNRASSRFLAPRDCGCFGVSKL